MYVLIVTRSLIGKDMDFRRDRRTITANTQNRQNRRQLMRKAYKKARFRRVWFRRLNMSMKWSWVPIEMFDKRRIFRLPHRRRHDLRPWE